MNKLLVSNIIDIKSGSYELDFKEKKSIINIKGNVTLYIIDKLIDEIIINVEDNSTLNFYKYDRLLKNNILFKIIANNNTEINFNLAYINEDNIKIDILNDILGHNNKSNINIRNISNKNVSQIKANVHVYKDTKDNICLEDLKGINNGGYIEIEPNIICDSYEVVANHLTTIGSLDKEMINYLNSKGISERKCRELLLNGFIFSNMESYIKDLVGGDFFA